MKKVLFLLLALTLLAPSCKKGDSDSSFSCKIDGTDFKVEGLGAYAFDFSSYFTIYGVADINGNSSNNLVYLSLPLNSTPGTYKMDSSDRNGYYIDPSGGTYSTLWGQGTGTITIDEISDTHVKGSFEFTPYNSDDETKKKTITGGKFDVLFR
jgi:Family of unknown function (DUF6252)